ncbi:hypothetical protein H9Q08_16385 [Chryseobacterium sp. PS-8]|uniref:Leucine-rich repeat domain-containing protein n=1 Tax=Chryseobacterium indicum TaxID=2766954 RepID=A0ABS9C8F2_9FLAO|nr:hypothetical protein [Chryseobacterium sp. PS-8]MCF2220862.1 hypothetical protein [Chryseobacterium sp. PS-8]
MSTENAENQINISTVLDEEAWKIEEILGIAQVDDSKKHESIYTLKLNDIVFDDFSKFLPYLSNVRSVYLTNCTIANFSELLKLKNCDYFYLDNVTFRNSDCTVERGFPYEVRFSNMNFDAACLNGFHLPGFTIGHKYFEIQNCHIENIQELNNIGSLSQLNLCNITFTYVPNEASASDKSIYRISISDSQFKDISFIPFKKSVKNIDFTNCRIGSFEGISEFKKLEEIGFDTNTEIEDTEELENPFGKEVTCSFVKGKKPFSLKNVLSIKNYIHQLEFVNFKEKRIDYLREFKKVNSLLFDRSKFYVDAFLPISKQIKTVDLRDSEIKKHNYFSYYKNLKSFELCCILKEVNAVRNFTKLLPLRKQLQELSLYKSGDRRAGYSIEKFTALESLKISNEISVKTAESILTLKKLRKLEVMIEKTKKAIHIGRLKKLEFLNLWSASNIHYKGFEHLKKLKSLSICSPKKVDINTFPKIKSLRRLSFSCDEIVAVKGLNQFPNLKFLQLKGIKKVQLKTMKKLKVLDLDNSQIKNFSSFKTLPSLEKLDLSSLQNKIDLKEISKFPNWKWLTLLESYEVNDISALKPLKKLERLDLYRTKVTDVRVLNTLPNLKEVNLLVKNYELNFEKQLDRPEIAIYCGLPTINLRIWKEDEFGI